MPSLKQHKPIRAATLADVGKVAGVSAMAASVVLNGAKTSSRIAPATRKRIIEAAVALLYRPNAAARALANRRMDTLGVAVVFEGFELNDYFLQVFNGILEATARHQQNTTVFTLHDWAHDPARLAGMCDGRIDGLIIVAPRLTLEGIALIPAHTPFVALHANTPLPNVLNIHTDDEQGAFAMVSHLISRGHRRIMHLSGPPTLIGPKCRIHGYQQALAKAGIAFEPDLLLHAAFSTVSGHVGLQGWLRRHAGEPLPQAIFCVNDSVAIGCLEALAEIGLRVPEDISIAGFDDSLLARTTVPQLTTVRQPLRAMGQRAVEELLARIGFQNKSGAGRASSVKPIVYPVELVVRGSVAAPPTATRIVPPPRRA